MPLAAKRRAARLAEEDSVWEGSSSELWSGASIFSCSISGYSLLSSATKRSASSRGNSLVPFPARPLTLDFHRMTYFIIRLPIVWECEWLKWVITRIHALYSHQNERATGKDPNKTEAMVLEGRGRRGAAFPGPPRSWPLYNTESAAQCRWRERRPIHPLEEGI